MSSRGRRDELTRLELECEDHPVTCGCDSCGRLLELLGQLGQDDPDSMEDEEKPYWWNR